MAFVEYKSIKLNALKLEKRKHFWEKKKKKRKETK